MSNNISGSENAKKIAEILRLLAKKIEENPEILEGIEVIPQVKPKRKSKEVISLDFSIYQIFSDNGEQALREKLSSLDLKTLKYIISKNSFDPAGLARKWRNKDRLIDFIVERVSARSKKGNVFKTL